MLNILNPFHLNNIRVKKLTTFHLHNVYLCLIHADKLEKHGIVNAAK